VQYKVLKEGTGRTPKIGDTLVVNYRGTLVDGTEFANTFQQRKPAVITLDRVIPCQWIKSDGKPQYSGDRPGIGYQSIVSCHAPGRSTWNGGHFEGAGKGSRMTSTAPCPGVPTKTELVPGSKAAV
jgi:hypothetical protein